MQGRIKGSARLPCRPSAQKPGAQGAAPASPPGAGAWWAQRGRLVSHTQLWGFAPDSGGRTTGLFSTPPLGG